MSHWADSVPDGVTESNPQTDSSANTPHHLRLTSFRPSTPTSVPTKKINMPGFADSFWSSDYAGGLGVLFQKLQQGVTENHQIMTIASMRADAEEIYSERLGDIAPTIDRMTGGFTRDDGASVRKVRVRNVEIFLLADVATGL